MFNPINKILMSIISLVPESLVYIVAKQYVAGINHDEAIEVVESLNSKGYLTTLDILGEHTKNKDEAISITNQYIQIYNSIKSLNLICNISVKPTHIGADIDEITFLAEGEEPLGRIYFHYFTDEETLKDSYKSEYPYHEMSTFIGLRDDIYEKLIYQTFKGDIDYIRFDTICRGYTSSFEYGSARDLILDQSHISECHGIKNNISKTVLQITDLAIKFSN